MIVKLNAVPPHSATVVPACRCPVTGIIVEIVPGVCPGVMIHLSALSPPSVSVWPSFTTMSRAGFVPFAVIQQIPVDQPTSARERQ